ncbi:MAG: hypothetical protein L3J53_00995 [Proteobacteria bacterium]|nr:hypothetical protein [Pseudomonadota bacterium]
MKNHEKNYFLKKLNLKQLYNQRKLNYIKNTDFFKCSSIIISKKLVKILRFLNKNYGKEFLISLYLGTMLLLVFATHVEFINYKMGYTLLIASVIAFGSMIVYKKIFAWLGRPVNNYEVVVLPYLLFLAYLIYIISIDLSRFITFNYGILPNSFTPIIGHLSKILAIQSSIITFLFPLMFLIVIDIANNSKWRTMLFKIVLFILAFYITYSVAFIKFSILGKNYTYWIEKYSFTDIVLCDGNVYRDFNAHRYSSSDYIWVNNNILKNEKYKKLINIDACNNKKYCRVSCKKINEMQSYINNVTTKIDFPSFP